MRMPKNTEGGIGGVIRSPKTVLGFFALIVAILFLSGIGIIRILAADANLHYLIIPILIFLATVILLVLIGVFITAWRDPTILMLGQVTGEVYLQYRRLTLGDSNAGESVEDIKVARQLPAGTNTETDLIKDQSQDA